MTGQGASCTVTGPPHLSAGGPGWLLVSFSTAFCWRSSWEAAKNSSKYQRRKASCLKRTAPGGCTAEMRRACLPSFPLTQKDRTWPSVPDPAENLCSRLVSGTKWSGRQAVAGRSLGCGGVSTLGGFFGGHWTGVPWPRRHTGSPYDSMEPELLPGLHFSYLSLLLPQN